MNWVWISVFEWISWKIQWLTNEDGYLFILESVLRKSIEWMNQGLTDEYSQCIPICITSILNGMWDDNKHVPKFNILKRVWQNAPGGLQFWQIFEEWIFAHTNIVHNLSYFGVEFSSVLQTQIKRTTNMADVHEIDGWGEKQGLLTQTGFSY